MPIKKNVEVVQCECNFHDFLGNSTLQFILNAFPNSNKFYNNDAFKNINQIQFDIRIQIGISLLFKIIEVNVMLFCLILLLQFTLLFTKIV